jgi:hypothetical protein
VDRQSYRVEDLGVEAEAVAGQFDLGSQPGAAERGLDSQVTPPAVVAEVLDGEREPVDLDPGQCLQRREGKLLLGCGEVEVGGEATGVAGAERAQRRAALEHQPFGEQASPMEQVQGMVLGDVEQSRVSTALDALVVAGEVTFGDARHEPVPTLR